MGDHQERIEQDTKSGRPSNINLPMLAKVVAADYNLGELTVFLNDYFSQRLDHIVNPSHLTIPEIVWEVIGYFDRRGRLVDLVRELGRDRPGRINLLDLLVPASPSGSSPPSTISTSSPSLPSPVTSSTTVDIGADEIDFYFVIEPDRRSVPSATKHKSPTQAVYVRIPAVSGSLAAASTSPQALGMALDRSGSMQGYKTDVARAAADYLLDIAQRPNSQVSVVSFDDIIEVPVPLQQVRDSTPHKSTLRRIAPRGNTNLFAAWQKTVNILRVLNDTWDRRVVLITDGHMNQGMTDPARFEQQVATVWRKEKIATSCISMGASWNVDLLNRLASVGGGSLHFIDTVGQAEQALYEAFHSQTGVVACNLRVELEPLGSAHISQVNGVATSLSAGSVSTFPLVGQLLTNVEEQLVLRIEFPSPANGQKVALLRCALSYETPTTAQTRKTRDKILYIYGETGDVPSSPAIIHQGVICTAHNALSRELFRQALGAYLRQDSEMGNTLLEQARFALQSTPTTPRGYQPSVNLQERRIRDLERFQGHVPPEYIKQKYIEDLSHRDVIWNTLCQLFDRLMASETNVHFIQGLQEQFEWANRMIGEYASHLPIPFNRTDETLDPQLRDQGGLRRREKILSAREFWLSYIPNEISRRDKGQKVSSGGQKKDGMDRASAIAILAGACFGLERTRQGTREEILELMESYLELRYNIQLKRRGSGPLENDAQADKPSQQEYLNENDHS